MSSKPPASVRLTGAEIRQRFLEFFERRQHRVLASASLIPTDDPTTLFNSAGMQPLQPYYQGLRPPPHPRLASCQKCLRIGDLEEVGRTDRHHTFFEMLGNFAPTGDYFRERALPWAWELVTEGLGLPAERLRVTVHPADGESRAVWREEAGVDPAHIFENADNWWGLDVGPTGPDTEIWWDRGTEHGCGSADCGPDHAEDCDRFLEVWNLVLPQYDRRPDGSLPPLPRPAVDTGMGLERIASVLQGGDSNFDTDLFAPLLEFVRAASPRPTRTSERVVADHLRAMTFVVAEGVLPGNEGRGYVLRRVIRRAALHASRMGLERSLADGAGVVVEQLGDRYPALRERAAAIRQAVGAEQAAFDRTLQHGMEQFERLAAAGAGGNGGNGGTIAGADAFKLHDTYGFPLEVTRELARERGLEVDEEGFSAAMAAQRARSRTALAHQWADIRSLPRSEFTGYTDLEADGQVLALRSGGSDVAEAAAGADVEVYLDPTPFYAESGGQVGDTGSITAPDGTIEVDDTQRPFEGVTAHLGRVTSGRVRTGDRVRAAVDRGRRREIARHHTATHLLNRALEELLGATALQRGSWVGPDHTTFDFPLDRALTPAELESLAARVDEQAAADLPLDVRVLPYDEAVAAGATHVFNERYGDRVRVVDFGGWSTELCGGTHCASTADVGAAVILSEGSIGHGLRRLDLTVGTAARELLLLRFRQVTALSRSLGVPVDEVEERVDGLRRELREAERRVHGLQDELRRAHVGGPGPSRREARVPLVLEEVPAEGLDDLRSWADHYLEALGGSGVVGVASGGSFVVKVSPDLAEHEDARQLAGVLGSGGGRGPELAQGKLARPAPEAFGDLERTLR